MYKGVRRNADVEDWYDARNRRSWARRVSLSMGGSGVVVPASPPPPVGGGGGGGSGGGREAQKVEGC